jgi:predicted ArsR family transcriptional regulator
MAGITFDERFFHSTRGRIVHLLKQSAKTVNDLAAALELTDNAVRAHLLSLERDRLVESAGTIKGVRKPHVVYRLTDDARKRFPRAYDSLLNRLLDVIKQRLPKGGLMSVLSEVGSRIGQSKDVAENSPIAERVDIALKSLEEIGGAAEATVEGDKILIRSESCPFAEAVIEHPEVCKVAESLVGEIVGQKTTETCDRTASPKCRFVIETQ